ncbi:MAG: hypothetical protein JWQ43_1365 [Glaciihabitans sp.]|nr:hypothetical protein [Glaciihabitans sp.]
MKTRSRFMATALVAASLVGLSVAAPAAATETNIDLGRFSIQDRGRSVDWTITFTCNRGDVYRANIDLTQRNNRRWDATGDARSDRVRCDGNRQSLTLNIPADQGRFTNGRARADVVVWSVRGRDRDRDWDHNRDGNWDHSRDFSVTQVVKLRGGWDNNHTPDGY